MYYHLFSVAVIVLWMNTVAAAEPDWLHAWQHDLANWLKSVEPAELTAEIESVDPEALKNLNDLFAASQGYGNMLVSKIAGVIEIPADAFTWQAIWRPELPLEQASLKDTHHGLESGQIWLPSHPTAANWLAWAYANDNAWNGYHGNAAVARRAAIIALVDLMMNVENHYYYHDPASSNPGRRYGIHQGIMGFTLTFNALTMLKVQEVLPENVRRAWRTGLKFLCSETAKGRPTGPANMRISFPVALYYAYLATEDEDYLAWYEDWEDAVVFGSTWNPAGIYLDGGAPDASYNGIALHRVAELYAINSTAKLQGLLTQAYTLRNYMSLPEPDGHLLAPSHFNDRCASSFPNDQYHGREVMFALDVPEALPALKHQWRMLPADVLAERISRESSQASKRAVLPHPWGKVRVHDWQPVLALPYAMYHQPISQLLEAMDKAPRVPADAEESYTRSFNDHFFAVKRPAYTALFYAGPVSASDQGRTNYRNMLSDHGGMFNGFAGGGLSAFWVRGAGSLILGRMNQYENYERKTVELEWGTYQIPGWQDWMNNHVIGLSHDGKVVTSARCSNPVGTLAEDHSSLTIQGKIPNAMKRAGKLFDGSLDFQRLYTFHDDRLAVRLVLTADRELQFKSLYESLPVRIAEETTVSYYHAHGRQLAPDDARVTEVSTIRVRRGGLGMDIVFPAPAAIALISEETQSKQAGPAVHVRTLHVEMPVRFVAETAQVLDYELKSVVPASKDKIGD